MLLYKNKKNEVKESFLSIDSLKSLFSNNIFWVILYVKLWERGTFMIKNIFEENILIYIFIGLCILGVLLRMMLNLFYRYMVRGTDKVGKSKNKMVKHMKIKFESCYKLKIGVYNVDTFVDKNVLGQKICGLLLSTWENISGQVLYISLLIVPITVILGVLYDCGQDEILYTGAVGILLSSILIIVDKSINLATKKQMVHLNLMDYFENYSKVRFEQEISNPELTDYYRKEYLEAVDSGQKELNRRKEARKKKEEKRKEEERKIQLERKEKEEKRKEERRRIAAERREKELQKLGLLEEVAKPLKQEEDKAVKQNEGNPLEEVSEEIAASISKGDTKNLMSPEEEKIIEDILKEFFS